MTESSYNVEKLCLLLAVLQDLLPIEEFVLLVLLELLYVLLLLMEPPLLLHVLMDSIQKPLADKFNVQPVPLELLLVLELMLTLIVLKDTQK
jgi:hypothetical protein